MGPDFWTLFTFFGIPFVLGLLGFARGLRFCRRGYRQYLTASYPDEVEEVDGGADRESGDHEAAGRTWRENLLIGLLLVVGAGLLVAHSGRWLLRFL